MRYFLLFVLCSCTTLPEEEREWRQAIDKENWVMCQLAFRQANVPTISYHSHQKGRRHGPFEVKEDLIWNRCRSAIKDEYWIEY